jgi:hypothetical protein
VAAKDSEWYTTVPNRLKTLLEKLPSLGTPDKANSTWLASVGFSGGNDQSIVRVLKTAGLTGSDGAPTPTWNAFKGGDRKAFAQGVRTGYAPLFAVYPDAHQKDAEALMAFFRSKTSLAEDGQRKCVATFQTLAKFGDFSDAPMEPPPSAPAAPKKDDQAGREQNAQSPRPAGVGLTVNIQLQLPPSTDGEAYDKFFEAMAKHLRGLISIE